MDAQKYRVIYPLQGGHYAFSAFETFDEAVKEYIKRITPIDESCWNETRFKETFISKWSEKENKYVRLK